MFYVLAMSSLKTIAIKLKLVIRNITVELVRL